MPRRALVIGVAVALAASSVIMGCGASSDPAAVGTTVTITDVSSTTDPTAALPTTTGASPTTTGAHPSLTSAATVATSTSTSFASIDSPATVTSAAERELTLDGFGFFVPTGWTPQDTAVIATEFQSGAKECVSAEVIDDPAPSDSGSATLAHAAVQICVVDRDDALDLEQWLTQRGQVDWLPAQYGTCAVLSLPGTPEQQLAYAHFGEVRAEISVTVTTTADMAEQRRAEVADLLENVWCTTN